MHNAKHNNNFKKDFLLETNLSSTSLHATIYLRVILAFTLKIIDLLKKIEKLALSKQIEVIEIGIDAAKKIS